MAHEVLIFVTNVILCLTLKDILLRVKSERVHLNVKLEHWQFRLSSLTFLKI